MGQIPDRLPGKLRKRRQGTISSGVGPFLDHFEGVTLTVIGEQAPLSFAGEFQSAQRDVVSAPLHQNRGELLGNHRIEKRDVLLDDLFLQADGVRADDDPFAVIDDAADRGQKIAEALAHSGAGLHEKASASSERLRDRRRHVDLLRSGLIALQATSDRAFRGQDVDGIDRHQSHPRPMRFTAGFETRHRPGGDRLVRSFGVFR